MRRRLLGDGMLLVLLLLLVLLMLMVQPSAAERAHLTSGVRQKSSRTPVGLL